MLFTKNISHKMCILITPNYMANRATSPFLPPVSITFWFHLPKCQYFVQPW